MFNTNNNAQSPEAIAYQLMTDILNEQQGKEYGAEKILATYRACLLTVKSGSPVEEIIKKTIAA
jgi:hypothetical protein